MEPKTVASKNRKHKIILESVTQEKKKLYSVVWHGLVPILLNFHIDLTTALFRGSTSSRLHIRPRWESYPNHTVQRDVQGTKPTDLHGLCMLQTPDYGAAS